MNKHKLIIRKEMSLIQALKAIDEGIQKGQIPLTIDMGEASFPLTRDVFLVMKKRFRVDEFNLLLNHDYEVDMAHSIGIGAVISGVRAEFDREFEKNNIVKHNMTMWEYFLYELSRGWQYIRFVFQRKHQKVPLHKIKRHSPNTFLIVAGLIMSLSLLVFIFYFAVSKTYVYVVPKTTVRTHSANIIFAEAGTGGLFVEKNRAKLKKVSFPLEYSMKFTIETIDPNSARNAQGVITLYNELTTEQALKPQTRFVTEDGIVFRSENWVNVPAARKVEGITEIGMAEVVVRADQFDEAGAIIGARGNVPLGTYMSIPGLKFNRDKVYAKTRDDFTNGEDSSVRILTDPELERSKSMLREQINRFSRNDLQAWLDKDNKENGENYSLLTGESISLTGVTITLVSGQKVGDPASEIELRGNATITALVYDKKAVLEFLIAGFREKLLKGTDKELAIHEDSLRLTNIISREPDDSLIKATMEMNATITYDLENSTNELTRRMKAIIAGLTKSEAIDRLIAEGRVHEVEISFSPFWLSRVSSNLDNIEFIIRK